MTPEEKILWERLRARKFYGYKFLRQHPIIYQQLNNHRDFYIADFYCAEKRLVVEVDGRIHDFHQEYDENRDAVLNGLGMRVLHIKNDELKHIAQVLERIKDCLDQ